LALRERLAGDVGNDGALRPQTEAKQPHRRSCIAALSQSGQDVWRDEVAGVALEVCTPVEGGLGAHDVLAIGEARAGDLRGAVGLVGAEGGAVEATSVSCGKENARSAAHLYLSQQRRFVDGVQAICMCWVRVQVEEQVSHEVEPERLY